MKNWMLIATLGAYCLSGSVIAAEEGKLVHGPLATHDGQTLSFYSKDNNVTAYFTSPEEAENHIISDYVLIENSQYALGNVSIVAVFFMDLDLGGQDEVIVMYRDETGKPHLRAWGADTDRALPLSRFTPQLERVAASLDPFTVASARKAIGHLLPQQYLVPGYQQNLADPVFSEVLAAPDKYRSRFLRYFDEIGDDTESLKEANGYAVVFPDKFIERVNEKGEKIRFTLTMDIVRQGSCGMDEYGFAIGGLYYQNVTATHERLKEGPFVDFSLQGCRLIENVRGYYRGNVLDSEWAHYDPNQGHLLEEGHYREGMREGLWQEYSLEGQRQEGQYLKNEKEGVWQTFADSGDVIATKTWRDGNLNGLWQQKVQQKNNETAWVIEEEGQYLNSNKEGMWKEEMTTHPRYANYHQGLLEGEVRLMTLDGKKVAVKNYQHGLLNGESYEWFANGKLKRQARYLDGQLQKEAVYYEDNGQISQFGYWKNTSLSDNSLCQSLTSQQACDYRQSRLTKPVKDGEWRAWHDNGVLESLAYWKNGVQFGAKYTFDQSGRLLSFERNEGKNYSREASSYNYQDTGYNQKESSIRLLDDIRTRSDGRIERVFFQRDGRQLNQQFYWCKSNGVISVCGVEYHWHDSGYLASIKMHRRNKTNLESSWGYSGSIDSQTVKVSDDAYSERYYVSGRLFKDTTRTITDTKFAESTDITETRYYDENGNRTTWKEIYKHQKAKNLE